MNSILMYFKINWYMTKKKEHNVIAFTFDGGMALCSEP